MAVSHIGGRIGCLRRSLSSCNRGQSRRCFLCAVVAIERNVMWLSHFRSAAALLLCRLLMPWLGRDTRRANNTKEEEQTKSNKIKPKRLAHPQHSVTYLSTGSGLWVTMGARPSFLRFLEPTLSPLETPPEASGSLSSAGASLPFILTGCVCRSRLVRRCWFQILVFVIVAALRSRR